MGPVLGFRSSTASAWNCCVTYVFDRPSAPALNWNQGGTAKKATGRRIYAHGTAEVWVFEIPAALKTTESTVSYQLADGTDATTFSVPAKSAAPNIAYCSCNGFSDPKIARDLPKPSERWENLGQAHAVRAFHLLLMGGDQVYADQMWAKVPELNEWANKWRFNQVRSGFTQSMETRVRQHYFEIYTVNWSRPEMAKMLASIPTVMMWDDHDITDGWGSHPDELQLPNPKLAGGGVLPGLFTVAKEFFEAFQLRVAPGTSRLGAISPGGENLSSLHILGPIALLVADLRSERTRNQVVGDATWDRIAAALNGLPKKGAIKHLLVMSSIPVVYPNGGVLNNLAALIPWDPVNDPQDDLIDHWSDPRHHSERERFVRLLFKVSQEKAIRVTILAGDVHVAGQAIIESERSDDVPMNSNVITQLISSGIVHPPSGGPLALSALNTLARIDQNIYRGVVGRLAEFWSSGPFILPKRNWLSLLPIANGSLRAQWHVESMEMQLTKDIGACE